MDHDDEQTRDVYAHYGLAMYLSQCLEHGIVNALVVLRLPQRNVLTRRDIDEFMEGRFRKTLGALLAQLRSEAVLPTELETTLVSALERRNFLAHRYFRDRADVFVTSRGREQMLQELQADQLLFERADDLLATSVKPLRIAHGVTDSAYAAAYKETCLKLGIAP